MQPKHLAVINLSMLLLLSLLVAGCAAAEPARILLQSRLSQPTPAPSGETPATAPTALTLGVEEVVTGLATPVFVTHAGDESGRLFIIEKGGTIRIWRDDALLDTPFLDITDRVNSSGNEQGLLGLAFPPGYSTLGYFFVNYTDSNGDTVVARFATLADAPDQADATSEQILLQIDQPAGNHNGGMIAFGPDGYLYIGMGDGGGAGDRYENGQNPDALLGKMLRIDVTTDPSQPYTIPADNPWVATDWNGVDVRDEIWAVGLRNPWRFSFDRTTGDLWIGDVGQNQYEEINFTAAGSGSGLNYGWPIMEASDCYRESNCSTEGLVLPVAEYSHAGHCSVTGGYVYRGQAFPTLQGIYLYGDYCSGALWALAPDGDGGWSNAEVLRSDVRLSSFGEDEAGELYLVDMGGRLLRLVVE